MQLRSCQPVQTVGALLLHKGGNKNISAYLIGLNERSIIFADAMISMGADWLVIEGIEDKDRPGDILLPSVPDAQPLYKAGEKIYCAVGFELDAPEPVRRVLLAQFTERLSLEGPLVLVPGGVDGSAMDVFELNHARALKQIDLSELE